LQLRDASVRGLTPSVRAAEAGDSRAIGAIATRAWNTAYADLLAPEVLAAMDPVEQAADWHDYLGDLPAGDRVWVIGPPGAVWGFARTGPCPDMDAPPGAGEVHGLYLEPVRIGTGLGRQLFGHAVADLEARHGTVCVWHFAANDAAGRFYERAGFLLDGASRPSSFGVVEVRRSRPARR
jgi:GNAT superfamily N-acetyltransferase